ncbi:immunoglobulin I-set domain protein [Ostertagia ostertagi]
MHAYLWPSLVVRITSNNIRIYRLSAPPTFDASQSEKTLKVIIGQPVNLKCPARGYPPPKIVWANDHGEVPGSDTIKISNGGQMLEIKESQIEHAGSWVCTAENDAGEEKLEIFLDVWIPPTVHVSSDADAKVIGDPVTLVCEATGNPPPSIEWSKEERPIIDHLDGIHFTNEGARLNIAHLESHNAGNYTCKARNEAGSAESTVLVNILGRFVTVGGKITNITEQDEGNYTCVALNRAGNDSMFYTVGVVQAPTIPPGGAQSVVEGKMANIECAAEGHPAPVIIWLRNGIRVESGIQGVRYVTENKVLTITEVRSSDSGIYVCEAMNEAGTARQAYTLEVLVSPKIVSVSALKNSVALGSPFSLKCGARGYPKPTISWSINGVSLDESVDGIVIGSDGTLTVNSASGDAPRIYKCTAKNDAGQDEVSYEIGMLSAPIVKGGFRTVNSSEGESTMLNCDIDGDKYKVHWFKV